MLQFLSPDEQHRFSELQGRLAQLLISEAEQAELRALVSKAQNAANARTQAVETARRLIAENGIAAQELFPELSTAQPSRNRQAVPTRPNRTGKKASSSKPSKRSEQVLIQVKLDKSPGAPSRYKLGQKLGKVVSKNFKQLDVNGQLVDNLLKYATPLGKAHFATAAGRADLEAFATFVRNAPVAI